MDLSEEQQVQQAILLTLQAEHLPVECASAVVSSAESSPERSPSPVVPEAPEAPPSPKVAPFHRHQGKTWMTIRGACALQVCAECNLKK